MALPASLRVCLCSSVISCPYSEEVLCTHQSLLFFSNPVLSDSCSYYQGNPSHLGSLLLLSISSHPSPGHFYPGFSVFSPRGRPQSSSPVRPSPWCWHCWLWWRGGQQAVERQCRPDAGRRDQAPGPEASRHCGRISSAGWAPCRNSSVGDITRWKQSVRLYI